MLFEDSYLEVVGSSQGLFKDKGSKFIAYTFHIKDEDDVKDLAIHHDYLFLLEKIDFLLIL